MCTFQRLFHYDGAILLPPEHHLKHNGSAMIGVIFVTIPKDNFDKWGLI